RRGHAIKDAIDPGRELVNHSPFLIYDKEIVLSEAVLSERKPLWIVIAESCGVKRRHDVVRCPVPAIKSWVHSKDLLLIVIGDEGMVGTGIDRDPGPFLWEVCLDTEPRSA